MEFKPSGQRAQYGRPTNHANTASSFRCLREAIVTGKEGKVNKHGLMPDALLPEVAEARSILVLTIKAFPRWRARDLYG